MQNLQVQILECHTNIKVIKRIILVCINDIHDTYIIIWFVLLNCKNGYHAIVLPC